MSFKLKHSACSFVLLLSVFASDVFAEEIKAENLVSDSTTEKLQIISDSYASSLTYANVERNSLPWQGSFMFKNDEINQIYASVTGNSTDFTTAANDEVKAVNVNSDMEDEGPTTIEVPAFFLNSIMFYHSKNWALWINGKKIRYGVDDDKLKILKVGLDNAEVEWCSEMLDAILQPGWQNEYYKLSQDAPVLNRQTMDAATIAAQRKMRYDNCKAGKYEWNYVSKDGRVFVDTRTGAVKFNLDLHQTFVSKEMKVAEGKIEGSIIDVSTEDSPQTQTSENGVIDGIGAGVSKLADSAKNMTEKVAGKKPENIVPASVQSGAAEPAPAPATEAKPDEKAADSKAVAPAKNPTSNPPTPDSAGDKKLDNAAEKAFN
jgi:hypothetical protein